MMGRISQLVILSLEIEGNQFQICTNQGQYHLTPLSLQ
jgi:hypothetical protein